MGKRAAWIALSSPLDGVDGGLTVTMIDHPANPRHPTPWFTRIQGLAGFSAAFSFDQLLHLPPGETLNLRYRLSVIDGLWSRQQLDAHAAATLARWS